MCMEHNHKEYESFDRGEFKSQLRMICSSYGVELVGIAPSRVYKELVPILEKRHANGHYTSFEEKQLQKRVNPFLTMESCRSIIVCLFPYFTGFKEPSNISVHAYGRDYHIIVKDYLEKIATSLADKIQGFEYLTFTDNGPLPERHLAYLADLGFFGKNSLLITNKYGSYVFIGYIMNNFPFEPDSPSNKSCQNCGECIRHCPGNALSENFGFNPGRCISYITQKKGPLSTEESNILKRQSSIYGCDICQKVCPYNVDIPITPIPEFLDDNIYALDYENLRDMSEREFRKKYKDRAFSWRGRKVLLRNFVNVLLDKFNTNKVIHPTQNNLYNRDCKE
jgi:epoxyqueuosine reductase